MARIFSKVGPLRERLGDDRADLRAFEDVT